MNLICVEATKFPIFQKLLLLPVPINVKGDRDQDRNESAADDAKPRIHWAGIRLDRDVSLPRADWGDGVRDANR